jgi:immune inhibitor A
MNKKLFSIMGILALLLALVPMAVSAAAGLPDYKPVDAGPELRAWEPTQDRIADPSAINFEEEDAAAMAAIASTPYQDCVLDTKTWLILDDYQGKYIFTTFYLVAETTGSELWVQANLSWPDGDPRPTPEVSCEQAAYLLSEFDTNMYPKETSFFGMPDIHDGSASLLEAWEYFPPGYYANEAGRQVVLVSNIRDDSYYDYTYPNYIAGFYSPTFEAYFDRNIMSIDAYDWANRVGPDGSRPYLYESVFAHEYQHLLHDDYDPDEVTWLNESLSMFAEYLTGYVVNADNYTTFQEMPENSLVAWGDQGGEEIVADYGIAFLYQMYLYEKFGQEFIQAEFHNPDNGITSVNSTMASNRKWRKSSFAETYHDFSVAVLIDSSQNKYKYGFKALDVGIDIGTPDSPNPEAFDTPGAPPWGADYIWLTGSPKKFSKLVFNGVDLSQSPTPWTSVDGMLYSGTGDEVDNWAIFEAVGGGTLAFDTYWDLEDYWDFAFVQVSTDGGITWTSLENEYTTYDHDPNAYPTVVDNLPGITSWSCYLADDPCVVNMSFDLSAYDGQDILVAFRLVTDWATHFEGWYIDNVYVNNTLISDGTDASIFKDISELFPIDNNFTVTVVGKRGWGKWSQYQVQTMKLDDMTEEGMIALRKVFGWSDNAVMIVTFDAPEGYNKYADYTYEVVNKWDHGKKTDYRHNHSRPHNQSRPHKR